MSASNPKSGFRASALAGPVNSPLRYWFACQYCTKSVRDRCCYQASYQTRPRGDECGYSSWIEAEIEDANWYCEGLILLHVLEHRRDPEQTLRKLTRFLIERGFRHRRPSHFHGKPSKSTVLT